MYSWSVRGCRRHWVVVVNDMERAPETSIDRDRCWDSGADVGLAEDEDEGGAGALI